MNEKVKAYMERFHQGVDRRGTGSVKWDNRASVFGTSEVIPMWVADTDFPCPDEVVQAIQAKAAHGVYGYSYPTEAAYDAVMEKLLRDYDWKIEKDWIVFIDGVVGGLYSAVSGFSEVGEGVILQQPVYFPFANAIRDQGRVVWNNELILEQGRYRMDLEGLEEMPTGRLALLCNPHNPVGRVWTKQELLEFGQICRSKGMIVVSDEIHCDILLNGQEFTPFASLCEDFLDHSITFMAASKTFNVAGFHQAFAIIPDPGLRKQFCQKRLGMNFGNGFGLTALEYSFRYGEDYRDSMNQYVWENYLCFDRFLKERLPKLKVIEPEGTYLLWVDFSETGLDRAEVRRILIEECGIGASDGQAFGEQGIFMRFNIGCPRSTVEEVLMRMENRTTKFK